MISTKSHVTLTRYLFGDVKRISSATPAIRFFTSSKPRSVLAHLQPNYRMQARQRTQQITNQLRRPFSNMSNNKDLTMEQVFNVKDKVALVTGGGSGIGLMITQTLAVNGAKVYIVGRTEEKLEKVVEVHGKDIPGQIIPIVGDVATKDGVQ
jgi:FlaA1/EpsC-like NDP-sugar epimerase